MKRLIPFVAVALLGVVATSCGGSDGTPVNERPLVFYNRQPVKAGTTEVDSTVMNWSDLTFYGGFDAVAGGDTQGQMVLDYIKENADSSARTIGVRKALGTGQTADDTVATGTGKVKANDGKEYTIKELACQEMRDNAGPWSQTVAASTMATWLQQYGNKINLVVSNNDGMAEGMIGQYAGRVIPTFGYDANASTLDLILKGGSMKGTISQNHHAQVLTILQLLRNYFDGLTGSELYTAGFSKADKAGNQILSADVSYTSSTKALLAENGIVTAENAQSVKDDTLDSGIKNKTSDTVKHKILWTVYSATDNFLNQSYVPTAKRYLDYYNFDVQWVYGDGTAETSITNSFTNLENYDAYVVNMVETTSGSLYQNLLDQAS